MHELSYVVSMVNLACETAAEAHASKIRKIVVQIGEMTGVLPQYFESYYPQAVKGTPLEGSILETESVPVKAHCNKCSCDYHPDQTFKYLCPKCGSGDAKLIEGKHVILKSVEIESDEDDQTCQI